MATIAFPPALHLPIILAKHDALQVLLALQ